MSDQKTRRVLILEDDPVKLGEIKSFLLEAEVVEVYTWKDFQAKCYEEGSYDLIILDNQVPMLPGCSPEPRAYYAYCEARSTGHVGPIIQISGKPDHQGSKYDRNYFVHTSDRIEGWRDDIRTSLYPEMSEEDYLKACYHR